MKIRVRSLVLLCALLYPAPDTFARGSLSTAKEVEECVLDNLPKRSSVQVVRLDATDRMGTTSRSKLEIYWQRFPEGQSRTLARLLEPPTLRGTALLIIERSSRSDMFLYLPEIGTVRRIGKDTLSGSLFGTDLSYEDFDRLERALVESESRLLPDSKIDGCPVYVLEAEPSGRRHSAYARIVTYVDRETCVPIRMELFGEGERLLKVMVVPRTQVTRERSGYVARQLRIEDPIDLTRTELFVEEIEIDRPLPRKLFSQKELESKGR